MAPAETADKSVVTLTANIPAAAPAAQEMVTLVNQGRGDIVILPGKKGTLLSGSRNTLSVPQAVADRVRRHHKTVKNVKDIFPDMPDLSKLQAENTALKARATTLEKMLNGSDQDKASAAKSFADEKAEAVASWSKEHDALTAKISDLSAKLEDSKAPADVAALQAQVADLTTRLQAFLSAETRKDLDALKIEHKDAVPAPAVTA